jgi:predicted nucleic acid-binding protein
MTRYTVDAVAMAGYLVGGLPSAASEIFERAENGIDVVEAPSAVVGEAMWAVSNKGTIAGIEVDMSPNEALGQLVNDGPVHVAESDEHDLAVAGSFIEDQTLHDALLIANHRVRGTAAIVTNEGDQFFNVDTTWS